MKMAVKIETLKKDARAFYALGDEANGSEKPYSPANATNAIAKKRSYPKSRLIDIVADVYYAENGAAFPLPASAANSTRSFRSAVKKRRDARGRLGRWEVIAESASATLGTPVSVAAIRSAFAKAGGDETTSYTGRGTRAQATATRADETIEVESTLPASS
jgi:hypothetical protein